MLARLRWSKCVAVRTHNAISCRFKSEMRTAWLQHLAARPDAICAIQSHLQCSGFNLSCAEVHHSECPQDCDVSNSFTEPCYSVAYDVTVQYFKLLTVWTVIVMVLAAISAVACWTLWYWLKGAIQAATEELQRRDGMDPHVPRALAVVRNLSPERQRRLQVNDQAHVFYQINFFIYFYCYFIHFIFFPPSIFFHFMSFHFISFHFISFHFISFHFILFCFVSYFILFGICYPVYLPGIKGTRWALGGKQGHPTYFEGGERKKKVLEGI